MKTKTMMVGGVERTIKVFPFREYDGLRADDEIVDVMDPDRRWIKRNGELLIYDDAEYAKADS